MTIRVDIRRAYGAQRIAIDFESPLRGISALLGPSGAGKSTAIGAVSGIVRPDAGVVRVGERTLYDSTRGIDLAPERRRVGHVFQDAKLFPHMSVRDNLLYGWRRARGERRIGVETVVGLLGIGALLGRRPAGLSGGERQRVALGRALLAQPEILLMDEPLASLDPGRREEVLPYVERLSRDLAIPIIYVSHNTEEVIRLADWVVVVEGGGVVASGPAPEVLGRADLRHLTGVADYGSVLDAVVAGHDASQGTSRLDAAGTALACLGVESAPGTRLRLRIRARDVSIALSAPADTSVMNVIPCTIEGLEAMAGGEVLVRLRRGGFALVSSITEPSARRLGLAAGQQVFAMVKAMTLSRPAVDDGPR